MNRKYRVAVIGTGLIGATSHIPAYQALSDRCEIIAVYDNRKEAAEFVAKRNGIEKVYTDSAQMLEECRPDIVSVCTPNRYHKDCTIAALKAGAHVICEKPVCMTYADICEVYETARQCGRLFIPCHNNRFGQRETIRDLVKEGLLGDVYFGELECVRRRGIPDWGAFHLASESIGGPFCDVGVHFVDSLLFILGNPEFESIYGMTAAMLAKQTEEEEKPAAGAQDAFLRRPYHGSEFSVEDHAAGSIRFQNGLFVNFKFSWALNAPECDGIRLAGSKAGFVYDKLARDQYRLYGMMGKDMADTILDLHTRYGVKGMENPGHYLLIRHFLNVCDGVEEMMITEAEIRNLTAILEAFYLSAKRGGQVTRAEIIG